MITVLVLLASPHIAVHADHADQRHAQFTVQLMLLQPWVWLSNEVLHCTPPGCAIVFIVLVLDCCPPMHVTLHVSQLVQLS